jgi:hypothetical protein
MKNIHTKNDSQSVLGAKVLYIFNTQWTVRAIRKKMNGKHNVEGGNNHDRHLHSKEQKMLSCKQLEAFIKDRYC